MNETFSYRGRDLRYYFHMYNLTHLNERCVELAVAADWMSGDPWVHRLEVGNVLGHYPILPPCASHVVVDRYESDERVLNWDVFAIGGRWDEIVALSTIEHVRWDEPGIEREDGASQRAIEHLRSLLAPGGRMLITIPTGHNEPLDRWLATGAGADAATIVGRIDAENWAELDPAEFRPYGVTQQWAEAVWIGEWVA